MSVVKCDLHIHLCFGMYLRNVIYMYIRFLAFSLLTNLVFVVAYSNKLESFDLREVSQYDFITHTT